MGVVSKDGEYRLIDTGPLPEAVAASAAIPYIFNPVNIPGEPSQPLRSGARIPLQLSMYGTRTRLPVNTKLLYPSKAYRCAGCTGTGKAPGIVDRLCNFTESQGVQSPWAFERS